MPVEMPHALKFLRAHSNSFGLEQKRPDKKGLRALSGAGINRPSLNKNHSSQSSIESNHDMKRISLSSPRHSSSRVAAAAPASVGILIESPPLVYYGTIQQSSGALLSGQLQLTISEEKMLIKSVQLKLVVSVRQKKPFHQHCPECAHQNIDLKVWDFVKKDKEFAKGVHNIPFSHLLQGHLPITMHGSLCVIDYVLKAIITPVSGQPIFTQRELPVSRAIPATELPKQSIRIFPPTNLTAHVELPNVIHPIGEFNCQFRLDGVIRRNTDTGTQTHWKLKRLTWRLEETQKVISPACAKHAAKSGAVEGERKGMAHTETKLLNTDELKSGWKCDYSAGASGSIEMMFPFSIRGDMTPLCSLKAEDGTEVSHALIVEMIVAEEFAPIKKPSQITPTGAARVLRMHFNTTVTERSGLGISWDEEMPPMYDDVPDSPPHYPMSRPGSLISRSMGGMAASFGGRGGRETDNGEGTSTMESSPTLTTVEDYAGSPIMTPSGAAPSYESLDRIEDLRI